MFVVPWLVLALGQAPAAGSVEVAGRVVDAKQRPVVGAELWVSTIEFGGPGKDAKPRTTSDGEGRFRLTLPPAKHARGADLPWAVWAMHPEHAVGGRLVTRQSLAKAKDEPLVMRLAERRDSAVRVLRFSGEAAAGARVIPLYVRVEPASGAETRNPQNAAFQLPEILAERLAATTGPDGRGKVAGIAPGDLNTVVYEVEGAGRQRSAATPDSEGISVFTVAPVGRLAGRITVADPNTLQGARLFVFSRPAGGGPSASTGSAELVPDASGRFEAQALAVGELYVTVKLAENARAEFVIPKNKSIVADRLTEITITEKNQPSVATRALSGRVLDTKGNPIVGATVFQSGDAPERTETTTNADGRFSLPGVAQASTFVFARAKGFRFAGHAVPAGATELTFKLTREDERPAETMRSLAPAATPEQESAAAHRLIDAYATKSLEKGDTNDKVRVLEVLARVDPARTLELTEGNTLTEPFLKAMIRQRVAAAMVESAPDEATAIAESIDDPAGRTLALFKVVEALPAIEKAKKQEILDRALVSAKAAREPTGIRMLLTAEVAEKWLDMGLTEKGTALLREIQPDAEQLPDAAWPAYAKGVFAEELCQVDLDAALKLTKGLSDAFEYDRHHGNIAHELAAKDPAAAERVLGMVKQPYQQDDYTVRVVYRMAPVDLARARRLAATPVNPVMRGYALGVGALGLANAKKTDDARALLREAMEALGTVGGYAESPTRHPADRISTCVALAAVAEHVDPDVVAEMVWRALSLRYPRTTGPSGFASDHCDLRAALLLARYDRSIARALVERHIDPEGPQQTLSGDGGLGFVAAAMVDPAWAVELVERLPDDADQGVRNAKNSARLAVAAALARHGEARWKYLQNKYAYLWVVDTEDLGHDL